MQIHLSVYSTCHCQLRLYRSSFTYRFNMVKPSAFSSQGSTIVVDPGPQRCCGRCHHSFPETATYFKPLNDGGFAVYCIVCCTKKSAARRTKKATEQPVVAKTLGRKRRVLGDWIRMCSGKRLGLHQKSL